MVIWLASFPRSGNTLFRIAMKHFYGIPVHSLNGDQSQADKLGQLMGTDGQPRTIDDLEQSSDLSILKTHRLPSDHRPAICLVRDGRDVLVSYTHYLRNKKRRPEAAKPFRLVLRENIVQGHPTYGAWSHNVLAWWYRSQHAPTVWIKFEDLIKDPGHWVGEALRQLGVSRPRVTDEPLPSFTELRKQTPRMFRKGQAGGWRDEMPEALHQYFWDRHAAAMDLFGYQDARPVW